MVMVKLMIQSTKMMVDLEKQVLSNDNMYHDSFGSFLAYISELYKIFCMSRSFALQAFSLTPPSAASVREAVKNYLADFFR